MTTPNAADEELITLKNDISARLYGQYYYELPDGRKGQCTERDMVDSIMPLIQAYTARAVEKAEERLALDLMGTLTEGIIDDGDLFIKRKPLEKLLTNKFGYERFKAFQEAVDARPTAQKEDK